MSNIRQVRSDAIHPHRVPKVTPLGWVSNRPARMVSVDLSETLRANEYATKLFKVGLSHAAWAASRHVVNVVKYGTLMGNDRYIRQVMASYKVKPEFMDYAVAKVLIGVANAPNL